MSSSDVVLLGFAYGEHLDGLPPRSLGYRLLTPLQPEPWCAEVDALARLLEVAPYPDHWPATDLFCSMLLPDGQRLVALARYGLTDHTASHRRGGVELVGVLSPGELDPCSALAVYRWLRQRRAEVDDPRLLGGRHSLDDILSASTAVTPACAALPVLPVRLWQDGVLLFAALSPSDPDAHLALLERPAVPHWQWLPLVGPAFPLETYAQRGPLVAWTPNLLGVAVKLESRPAESRPRPGPRYRKVLAGIGVLLLLCLAANLWATLSLPSRLPRPTAPGPAETPRQTPQGAGREKAAEREKFARALHRLLLKEAAPGEFKQGDQRYINYYKSLLAQDRDLYVESKEGRAVVGALSVLARRRIDRIEMLIRQALPSKKGFDPELVELACKRVREELAAGVDKGSAAR